MKGILAYMAVAGSVLALLTAGLAGGMAAEEDERPGEGPDNEMVDPFEDELFNDDDGTENGPSFRRMTGRVYRELTAGFNARNSAWGRLPPIKEGLIAEDPGEWMKDVIEEDRYIINATDQDDDGTPEKVVVANATAANGTVVRWRFVYTDRDDDSNPEKLHLTVTAGRRNGTNASGFRWTGQVRDGDDDGHPDFQGYRVLSFRMRDVNGDGRADAAFVHRASYARANTTGNGSWDRIGASASRSHFSDMNADGNPERIGCRSERGSWADRSGNGRPERFAIHRSSKNATDMDSDGNREQVNERSVDVFYLDRNDDRRPELVKISIMSRSLLDRDDDGRWDVIKTARKSFIRIDRNSDGRPEVNRWFSDEKNVRPGENDRDPSRLGDRIRNRLRDRRGEEGPRDEREREGRL